MTISMPETIEYGKVVGRFIKGIDDSLDEDDLPDVVPILGKITFIPTSRMMKEINTGPPTTFARPVVTVSIGTTGLLTSPSGNDGVKLITGDYKVTYELHGATIRSHDIVVLSDHHDDTPLDLTLTIPPGGPVMSKSQYAELTARLSVIESSPSQYAGLTGRLNSLEAFPFSDDAVSLLVDTPNSDTRVSLGGIFSTPAAVIAQVPPLVVAALAADDTPADAAAAAVDTVVEGLKLLQYEENLADTRYLREWVDSTGKVAFGIRPDGYVDVWLANISKAVVADLTLAKVNGTTLDNLEPEITGLIRAVVDSTGKVSEHALDKAGRVPQWIINAWASRMVIPVVDPTTYKPTYAPATPVKIVSGPDIVAIGDSLTAAYVYTPRVASRTGRTVYQMGVGGEGAASIFARHGSQPYVLLPKSPATGIPADTSQVEVEIRTATGGLAYPLFMGSGGSGGTLTFFGKWGTIAGTITCVRDPAAVQYVHHAGDRYMFNRTTAGSAIPVPRPLQFLMDSSDLRRGDIHLYWVGRNGVDNLDGNSMGIEAAIRYQRGLEKRYLVLSVLNGFGETTGSTNHTSIKALNDRLRLQHGRRFVDVRQYLVSYGLADALISPTAQDITDVAGDTIPDSLRSDTVHLETVAYNIVGDLVADRLIELGWI